jgi:hypothetical protein
MTTSTLATETFNNEKFNIVLTEYSFDVLSTENKVPINKITIAVEEADDIIEVTIFDNHGYHSKPKEFKNSDDAHFFAMKKAITIKSKYN